MLTTFAIIIAAIVVVAVAAAPKVPGQQAASTPAASASPAPASVVTDPSGATCTALDGQGYCPGDDPTTPAPTPTGPQQVALGQPITISDTSTNATEGTITVLSAMVTTSPADPSFGSPPANGYYVVVHVSATADQGYTSGMQVNALDFYAKVAGQHFDEGNGNAFQALNSGQQSQDITATLAAGETATGWEAFDVPRPHGYIVYAPNFQGPPLAEWRF